MRKKFKILYPQDHPDVKKRGQVYKPPGDNMIVMNQSGIFFEYCGMDYYPFITKLSNILPRYDVVYDAQAGLKR